MNKIKVVEADVFLQFAENVEATLEILSSEIPIETPRRQKIEQSLKHMRDSIAGFREKVQLQK
jgi:hypothetical protein